MAVGSSAWMCSHHLHPSRQPPPLLSSSRNSAETPHSPLPGPRLLPLLSVSMNLPSEPPISGHTVFVFCVWLISLSIMSSKSVRVVAGVRTSFLFSVDSRTRILFLPSPISGRWRCFHPLALVKDAALSMAVQISVHVSAFSSLGSIPRSGITSLCKNSILTFLRDHRPPLPFLSGICFLNGCTGMWQENLSTREGYKWS